ncbi:MAG: Glu/Leu/Phe/Val dehydrogenase dimerization domain-containing protein [Bacillus sp. (in: firmicutes)]
MMQTTDFPTDHTMKLFEQINGHEQVLFCNDPATGLKAIIAIHDTTLGPALGGCRMFPYPTMDKALEDVLRLSKGMTYKCAASDVDFGGGKAVIIGNPATDKSPELFRALGQFIQSLGGRFYTGTDLGTSMEDFVHASKETEYIVGIPEEYGGGGDSSVPTAFGVLCGIRATNQMLKGIPDCTLSSYAVQGLGKVGYKVVEQLLTEGAHVYVTDINENVLLSIESFAKQAPGKVTVVSSQDIYETDADLFVPCALGGIINDATIPRLKAKAIVGSANNQLQDDRHAMELFSRGILYAPDYIVNAGGLIQVSDELYGPNKQRVMSKAKQIHDVLTTIFNQSTKEGVSTLEAANRLCEQKLEDRKNQNSFFTGMSRPKWTFRQKFIAR